MRTVHPLARKFVNIQLKVFVFAIYTVFGTILVGFYAYGPDRLTPLSKAAFGILLIFMLFTIIPSLITIDLMMDPEWHKQNSTRK